MRAARGKAAKMEETLSRLGDVFREVFEDDALEISLQTTPDDIEAWDSLRHVTLIIKVERAFGVKFTSGQVAKLTGVSDLVALLETLRSAGTAAISARVDQP